LVNPSETARECEDNYFTEMCSGSEKGSYLRLIDACITRLEGKIEEEEEKVPDSFNRFVESLFHI